MGAIDHTYAYSGPSTLEPASGLLLSTSGGSAAGAADPRPAFFDGFLTEPGVAAAALLVVAKVARTRFYRPPSMVAATIAAADPVVSSDGRSLRFESFSACCGVYAQLHILPEGLDPAPSSAGTTNVDVNPPMRSALGRVSGGRPLHLRVGQQDLTVTTAADSVVERRVPLPERWLRGFAETHLVLAGMTERAQLPAAAARRFLRTLPASARSALWAVPAGSGLRVTSLAGPGAVGLAGPERLTVLDPVLAHTSSLTVFGAPPSAGGSASAWVVTAPGAQLTIALSPQLNRGFSGEGQVLDGLGDDAAADDADLLSVVLAAEPEISIVLLAARTGLDEVRVVRALTYLSAAGRVGYDVAQQRFFHRELPFEPGLLESMHPRLRSARALIDAGAVTLTVEGAVVRTTSSEHQVTFTGGRAAGCTCPWWGRHRGERGPCKHVLAATMFAREGTRS